MNERAGEFSSLVHINKNKWLIWTDGWINPNRKLKSESMCEWISLSQPNTRKKNGRTSIGIFSVCLVFYIVTERENRFIIWLSWEWQRKPCQTNIPSLTHRHTQTQTPTNRKKIGNATAANFQSQFHIVNVMLPKFLHSFGYALSNICWLCISLNHILYWIFIYFISVRFVRFFSCSMCECLMDWDETKSMSASNNQKWWQQQR